MLFSGSLNRIFCLLLVLCLLLSGCMSSDKDRYNRIWNIAHEEGRYEDAVFEFTAFIEERPVSEWTTYARLHLGDCYLNLGNEEKARESFESIVEINWDQCTTNQALGCLEHLNSFHETRYPLHNSGRCPICK